MKTIEQAEKLICPFISDNEGVHIGAQINCKTTDCMAWVTTKTHEQTKQFVQCGSNDKRDGPAYIDGDKLPREKYEGYCLRLKR